NKGLSDRTGSRRNRREHRRTETPVKTPNHPTHQSLQARAPQRKPSAFSALSDETTQRPLPVIYLCVLRRETKTSRLQMLLQKLRRRRIHLQPVRVTHEVMRVVGNDQLFERHVVQLE